MSISKGLDGIVVDTTSISEVDPATSTLVYRGYNAADLADQCQFEEVAYLLWYGDLPTREQLASFTQRARLNRTLDDATLKQMTGFPKAAHPMDVVRTAVSCLGMATPAYAPGDKSAIETAAVDMLAKIPTIIAAWMRLRKGQEPIAPRQDLGFCENFFNMGFGKAPDPLTIKVFEVSMILYAEHSFNASTFTARVVTSTLSDIYSAVTAAIGALKGPLHGGANEEVMHMLKEIGSPSKAQQWILDALAQKRKVMGFGHRVYKKQDSRAPTMDRYGRQLGKARGQLQWHEMADIIEKNMVETKNIYPNLDYPAAPAYYLMGFDIDLFTPLFIMSRITGWCAHIMEQSNSNRLIRPLAEYVGPAVRPVVPIEKR
jgi:2-methylcitrate synthase